MTGSRVRFGVVADCQYADRDRGDSQRHYRAALGRLHEAVRAFNTHELDFVLGLGDMVDRDLADLAPVTQALARSRAPVRHLVGNHDLLATDGSLPAAVAMLGMPAAYYSWSVEAVRFVALDTNEDSALTLRRGSAQWQAQIDRLEQRAAAGQVNARRWNGGVSAVQQDWLDAELAIAADQDQQVVILAHHPFTPLTEHTALNADEVLARLDRSDRVLAVFSGHLHRGSFTVLGSVPHLTFCGMVQTSENAFAVVDLDLDANELRVVGYGREPDRVIPLRPQRSS